MSSWRCGFLALTSTLLLSACQSVPVSTPGETPAFVAHAERMRAIQHWEVEGRIGFRYEGDGGTGAMDWRQEDQRIEFSFRGPLGARPFRISGIPPDLLLETNDGSRQVLSDPDAELRARFGWSAPFESLRYWMVGVPSPDHEAQVSVDENGLLRELKQNGWQVSYDRYHQGEQPLPRKLTMRRESVKIQVIVYNWISVGSAAQ